MSTARLFDDPPDQTSPVTWEWLSRNTAPVAAVTLPCTTSFWSTVTLPFAHTSPTTRSLFFVLTSVNENNAYLNDFGGAYTTRIVRSALKPPPLPTSPVESMRYRLRPRYVTTVSYRPSALVSEIGAGTAPPEACSATTACCTPDSATCS